jgi:hypothetical protein
MLDEKKQNSPEFPLLDALYPRASREELELAGHNVMELLAVLMRMSERLGCRRDDSTRSPSDDRV